MRSSRPTPRMPVRPVSIAAMADHTIESPGLFLAADDSEPVTTDVAGLATEEISS